MVNSNDGIKTESLADRFNITKSILFRVYRRICGAIANNLSGQYVTCLIVRN